MRQMISFLLSVSFVGFVFAVTADAQAVPAAAAEAKAVSDGSMTVPRLVSLSGVLKDRLGKPLTGVQGVTFALYKEQSSGAALWLETQNVVADDEGRYTALLGSVSKDGLPLEFFTSGESRWLGVQTNLPGELEQPRALLVSVPYALKAGDAETLGGQPLSAFVLAKSTEGGVTKSASNTATADSNLPTANVNQAVLGSGTVNSVPKFTDASPPTIGNSQIFDDGTNLTLGSSGGLRILGNATSPNLIGGFSGNGVTTLVVGATISGGGQTGNANRVTDDFGTLGGGDNNRVGDDLGTTSDKPYATVGGGHINVASATAATVGGGQLNIASGFNATIAGGQSNRALAANATIAGGGRTDLANDSTGNRVTDDYGTVGGGGNNQAGNGDGDTTNATFATVAGGRDNLVGGTHYGTVSGGRNNTASGGGATVGGGEYNTASGGDATVGGGGQNNASGQGATIGGGFYNTATGTFPSGGVATVGGGDFNTASGQRATIGGGFGNTASAVKATIAGGGRTVDGDSATGNRVTDDFGTVGGGGNNQAGNADGDTTNATFATIGGGRSNTASAFFAATVGGGDHNTASGPSATVGGGQSNIASLNVATVGGGASNTASGLAATVPGGLSNTALGSYSFAAGRRAKANHQGAFVWADSTDADFASTAANQFRIRAAGGVGIGGITGALSTLTVKGRPSFPATGTVTVSVGSTTVTGAGTNFLSEIAPGDRILVDSTGESKRVATVVSDTFLTLPATLLSPAAGSTLTVFPSLFRVHDSSGGLKLILDDEGRLGLGGSATPAAQLTIVGSESAADGQSFAAIRLRNTAAGGSAWVLRSGATGTNTPAGGFSISDINNNYRLAIDSGGNVGIGTTNPTATLEVKVGGTTLADAWTVRSSRRFKTNIWPLKAALNKVERLRGVSFDWKETGRHDIGVVAEEVGQVVPEVVAYEQNGVDAKGVDYARLTPLLIEAVKEQQAQIRALQAEVEALRKAVGSEY